MASVGVIIFGFSVVLTAISVKEQVRVNSASLTKQSIDKMWLHPNQLLTDSHDLRAEFISSLYYNNLSLYEFAKNHPKTKPSAASILEEQNVSINLIQAWEDYLTFREFDQTGDTVWLNNFLQWAQSPYLREQFNNLKYNFAQKTIEFGELLFEYAGKLPVPTTDPTLYQKTVAELLKDPRLHTIYQERSELVK